MENDNLSEIIYMLADALNDFSDNVSRLHTTATLQQQCSFCWVSVDSPTKPQQGELVLVWTINNTFYCQTYLSLFTRDVTHWMRIVPPQDMTTNANKTN